MPENLQHELRRRATAVHIAVESEVANDLADHLVRAADALEAARLREIELVDLLEAAIVWHAFDCAFMRGPTKVRCSCGRDQKIVKATKLLEENGRA